MAVLRVFSAVMMAAAVLVGLAMELAARLAARVPLVATARVVSALVPVVPVVTLHRSPLAALAVAAAVAGKVAAAVAATPAVAVALAPLLRAVAVVHMSMAQ